MSNDLTTKLELDRPAKDLLRATLSGSLDLRTVPKIRKHLLKSVRRDPGVSMELDVSGITGIDTAGAALLLETYRLVTVGGGELRLHGTGGKIANILKLNQLEGVFGLDA